MDLLLRVGPWALCIQVKLYQQLLTLALTHGGINYVVHVLQEKQRPNCRFVSYVEKMIFKRICFFLNCVCEVWKCAYYVPASKCVHVLCVLAHVQRPEEGTRCPLSFSVYSFQAGSLLELGT